MIKLKLNPEHPLVKQFSLTPGFNKAVNFMLKKFRVSRKHRDLCFSVFNLEEHFHAHSEWYCKTHLDSLLLFPADAFILVNNYRGRNKVTVLNTFEHNTMMAILNRAYGRYRYNEQNLKNKSKLNELIDFKDLLSMEQTDAWYRVKVVWSKHFKERYLTAFRSFLKEKRNVSDEELEGKNIEQFYPFEMLKHPDWKKYFN